MTGATFVPTVTPLTGLNFFDGRLLRADDLNLEHDGLLAHVAYSNRAGGPGVVWGFELTGAGTPVLGLAAGLAVAPQGRVLHLPTAWSAPVAELVGGSAAPVAPAAAAGFVPCAAGTPAAAPAPAAATLYEVCLAPATGLCGQAEVLGRVCEDACVTATDRPYVVDGVTLLLRALTLAESVYQLPGVTREIHRPAQVAAAYFERERAAGGSLLSAAGLASAVWGAGASPVPDDDVVPIGVLGWNGTAITFLDLWTARRERMESPPRSYWAKRIEQRPWPVFLAQVLQFQARNATPPATQQTVPARVLVERGFVDLPPAGFLPVTMLSTAPPLRLQMQDLMGPGVDLRLCAVRRDQIAGELERAQHLDRVPLLPGLTDPAAVERVDVLVPDGIVGAAPVTRRGIGFTVDVGLGAGREAEPIEQAVDDPKRVTMTGAARVDLDRAVSARLAVVGAATQGLESLVLDLLQLIMRPSAAPAPEDLARRRLRPTATTPGLLRDVAAAVLDGTVRDRAAGRAVAATALAARAKAQVAALAAELTVDADPFTLADAGQGEAKTAFRLAVDLYLPREAPLKIVAVVEGFLRPAPAPADTPDAVTLAASGVLTLDTVGVTGIDLPSSPVAVNGTLRALRGEVDGVSGLAVTAVPPLIVPFVQWQHTPIEAQGALAVVAPGGASTGLAPFGPQGPLGPFGPMGRPVVAPIAGLAREAPDVARPGDAHHDAAERALAILTGAHAGDLTWAERYYKLLFPADGDGPARSEITPKLDWVLFRRRLREECEGGPVAPVAPPGPVTVWIRHDDADGVDGVVADIRGGDWPADGWNRADVAFDAGGTTLLTAPAIWRDRYAAAGGAARVAYVAYVGAAGVPTATVGVGRGARLLAALAPGTVPDLGVQPEFANGAPDSRVLPGTDGSVFLVTHDPAPALPPDRLDVVGVVLDKADDPLIGEIRNGTAPATSDRYAALAESDTVDVERRAADQLRTLLVNRQVGPGYLLTSVLWTHGDLDTAARAAMTALAAAITAAMEVEPELSGLTVAPVQKVGYDRGAGGPAALLFVLVSPAPIPV